MLGYKTYRNQYISSWLNQVMVELRSNPNSSRLLARNEGRWLFLKKKFNLSKVGLLRILLQDRSLKNKRLIYKCKSMCGGLRDRLRGIITSHFLALLSDRHFLIDMTFPCDINMFLEPHLYDWRLQAHRIPSNRSKRVVIAIDKNHELLVLLRDTFFIELWSEYDDIELFTNLDFLTPTLMNPWLKRTELINELSKLMTAEEANINTLFPLLFEILFKPRAQVLTIIDPLLQRIDKDHKTFLCIHLRIGKNPTNPNDEDFGDRQTIVDDMLSFIDHSISEPKQDQLVMVMSDSQKAVTQVLQHFANYSFTATGPILHIDRPTSSVNHCDGLLKTIIDFYLLGKCHISLITDSGFSGLANRRRESAYKRLYSYSSAEKRVICCGNIFLSSKWEPKMSINRNVFCPVFYNCSKR